MKTDTRDLPSHAGRLGRGLLGLLAAGVALSAASAGATAQGAPGMPDDAVVREGTDERRERLDAMERAPFPRDAWSKLSGWSGQAGGLPEGTALNASNTAGKVVVFYTWASFYQTSVRPMYQVGRLQEKYAEQGLVMVGVHHPNGFENASNTLRQRRAGIVNAHDADGAFREAIGSDQDPDFYIVDRAGQLRFADVATPSLEAAITILLAEEAEQAASLNERLAAEAERQRRELRRLDGIRQKIEVSDLPNVPFAEPDSEAYDLVRWPEVQTGDRRGRSSFTPSNVSLPDEGWAPAKPEPHGQGLVIWFWDPLDTSTFDTEMQWAEELQLANQRDLIVIGVAVSTDAEERRRNSDEDDEDRERRQTERREVYAEMLKGRTLKQTWLAEWEASFVDEALSGAELEGARRGSVNQLLPFVVSVASSDGMVRWVGAKQSQRLDLALETMLRSDPGIVSRRVAEEAFIRQRDAGLDLELGDGTGPEMDDEDGRDG